MAGGLGREAFFELNDFREPKMIDKVDTIGQMILNLFLMRPGNIPSMPHIGININQYLHTLENDIDTDELKQKIYDQCSELFSHVRLGDVLVYSTDFQNVGLLIVSIPIVGSDNDILFGFSKKDDSSDLNYYIQFKNHARSGQ